MNQVSKQPREPLSLDVAETTVLFIPLFLQRILIEFDLEPGSIHAGHGRFKNEQDRVLTPKGIILHFSKPETPTSPPLHLQSAARYNHTS